MQIHLRFQAAWDGVRTGLWFVPAIMMAASVALAAGGISLDRTLAGRAPAAQDWWVFASTAGEARDVAAALMTALITMTSLAFSITMVVLSLASSQFGPRLIRNFMASLQTQLVLGTFVMTILYLLIILAWTGNIGNAKELPFATISLGVLQTAVSVVLLVFHFHSLGRSIVSESVIERVGRELDDVLGQLPPLKDGEDTSDPAAALPPDFARLATRFGPRRAGYIQAIEFRALTDIARRSDAIIGFSFRPGDYVAEGGRGIAIYPGSADTPQLRGLILETLSIGVHRTPVQDPEYPVRHLVEIAVRALSPGTNDPYTAVAVVHRLSSCLARAMRLDMPAGVFADAEGRARVICPRPSHRSLVAGSFDQIRQNAADKPLVLIHLIEALARIAEHRSTAGQADLLLEQLDIILDDAERGVANAADIADIRDRARQVRDAVAAVSG